METVTLAVRVVSDEPLATELPPEAWHAPITPTELFYTRSHFPPPCTLPTALVISGAGGARTVDLDTIRSLPSTTFAATLECAGNGRSQLTPPVPGLAFAHGAVSTALWTGVALRDMLAPEDLGPTSAEIVFWGADGDSTERYARSLPLALALQADTLLAYAMNDAPLTPDHGAPLRLIVPGWYGMAAVKWIERIEVVDQPFTGSFQHSKYQYRQHAGDPGTPVGRMRVRALWCLAPGSTLAAGPQTLHGVAWSGVGPVTVVQCSADDGQTWRPASLAPATHLGAWQSWRWDWAASPGPATLLCRATDAAGNTQPLDQVWNMDGYGNNQVQRLAVMVGGSQDDER